LTRSIHAQNVLEKGYRERLLAGGWGEGCGAAYCGKWDTTGGRTFFVSVVGKKPSLILPLLLVWWIKMSGFARYANNVSVVGDAAKVETKN